MIQTQTQLVHAEKMASPGELTAAIVHEIQYPLNFVNNSSDINKELVTELETGLEAGILFGVKALTGYIKANEEKINHHGRRVQGIVGGMLQHSRSGNGVNQFTDINKLADEYLWIAFHGIQARDENNCCNIETSFDDEIGKLNIIPQEIGRVMLNLVNNAFYAVNEKLKQSAENYKHGVTVTTKLLNPAAGGWAACISVADNGNGKPDKIKDKILQPFFTSKPPGQGTGPGFKFML